jgi:hypothetical protein
MRKVFLVAFINIRLVPVNSRKRPWLAVVLAFIHPGLGHVYLREWTRALMWFGLVIVAGSLLIPESAVPSQFTLDQMLELSRSMPVEATFVLLSITILSMFDAYWLATQSDAEEDVTLPEEHTTCPSCGRDVDDDLDFCHWCTERLPQDADAEDTAQPTD